MQCQKMDRPSRLDRSARLMRGMGKANCPWFRKLEVELARALPPLTEEALGENGSELCGATDMQERAWCYADIVRICAGAGRDDNHIDGAASYLHAGWTLFAKRLLHVTDKAYIKERGEKVIEQTPGTLYIGNLCAAWHQVEHLPPTRAGPLLQQRGPGAGLELAVMYRTNVFGHGPRPRRMAAKSSPADVYDIATEVCARLLAREPLMLPTVADVFRL
jgi:hypothetical protein